MPYATREEEAAQQKAKHQAKYRAHQAKYRARHQDRVRAQDKTWRDNNRDKLRAIAARRSAAARDKFPFVFERRPVISEGLTARFREAADAAVFKSVESALYWARCLPDEQLSEILGAGIAVYIGQMRTATRSNHAVASLAVLAHRKGSINQHKRRVATASAFKHIIEKLDDHTVDGKKLGDCTRPDLLRAAARLEIEANEMTLDATIYRQFAAYPGMLKAGTRLRDLSPNERRDSGMLKLLTQRWGEDEEAA